MTPAQRAASLRADIRRHEHAYYVLDAPEIADAEFDALLQALQALEAAHPELVTPDSPTQRVGGAILEGLPTARHREPMLSLDNAYDEADARAFDERLRRALGAGEEALSYVAELKIDGLSIALTYDASGRAGPRRDARRRRRGRGRHAQRPHHPRPAADAGRRRSWPGDRGARRGVPAAGVVRAHQPRARGGRGAALRQRPQRRRRDDADARPAAGRGARARRVRLPAGRHRRRARGADAVAQRDARGVHALVAAGRASLAALRRHRRGDRLLPRLDRRAARPAVRDRRRRHQAGRHRTARAGRLDVEVPALGLRLQVPGAAGDDPLEVDRRQRRTDRRGDTVRGTGAGVPGRVDHLARHAAQRPGSGAEGHQARRLRPDREGPATSSRRSSCRCRSGGRPGPASRSPG